MTIQQQYRFFLQQLQIIYSLNEATIITDWVFESIAGIKRFEVVKNPTQLVSDALQISLKEALIKLLQHTPVQYVTGEAWFYNMKLKVDKNVLIPRPETEELVSLVIESAKKIKKTSFNILDIGTGSGCIAIAIKKNLKNANLTAIDISEAALNLAKENAIEQQVEIQFLAVDFLDSLQWKSLPIFDMIISNPPYIPVNEKEKLDKNVSNFEPHQALFVPDNAPLLFYKKIAAFAVDHLNYGGQIFMETHEEYANETLSLFTENFSSAIIKNDLYGKERMVVAIY